jgi:hypothetical protein
MIGVMPHVRGMIGMLAGDMVASHCNEMHQNHQDIPPGNLQGGTNREGAKKTLGAAATGRGGRPADPLWPHSPFLRRRPFKSTPARDLRQEFWVSVSERPEFTSKLQLQPRANVIKTYFPRAVNPREERGGEGCHLGR